MFSKINLNGSHFPKLRAEKKGFITDNQTEIGLTLYNRSHTLLFEKTSSA